MNLNVNYLVTLVAARTRTGERGGPRGSDRWTMSKPVAMTPETWNKLQVLAAKISSRGLATIHAPKLASLLLEMLLEQEVDS